MTDTPEGDAATILSWLGVAPAHGIRIVDEDGDSDTLTAPSADGDGGPLSPVT